MSNLLPLLHLDDGFAFYRGSLSSVSSHQHHAIELIVSEGPCELWQGTDQLHQGQIALLGADVPHRFVGDGWQWFIFIEPESRLGLSLRQRLKGRPVASLPDAYATGLPVAEAHSIEDLIPIFNRLIQRLMADEGLTPVISFDKRLENVRSYVKHHIAESLSVHQLTEVACLSEGRLMHLFKEQIGIPIRKYILWSRLQVAVEHALRGQNLTQAAYSGGFADSAHFSRTFSDMFGIRPLDVLRR